LIVEGGVVRVRRSAATVFNLADARDRARRLLPRTVFNYLDGGAGDEITLRENRRAFEEVFFRPRAAAADVEVRLSRTVFGADLSMPVVLAPVGGLRLFFPDGDRAAMRAAGAIGTAAILSTASGTPLEDVMAASSGPAWFQLYFRGGREGAETIVAKAQRAGFGALFVTLDVGAGGIQTERIRREVDTLARLRGEIAQDSAIPIGLNVRNAIAFAPQLVRRVRWTLGYLGDGVPREFASLDEDSAEETRRREKTTLSPDPGTKQASHKPPTWADMDWIRNVWKGPLIAKGLVTADDARRALDHGADGILVSNHGGRQLDGGIATLRGLPEVRRAVGDSVPVLIDGGVRRGSDVIKAIALGADAVVIGRAYAYGLAAGGEAGVRKVLDLFRSEMVRTMKGLGVESLEEIDASCIDTSRFFLAERLAAAERLVTEEREALTFP
jgi:isopentenyl diphosphate isomerase/L-lactate dehydrogenase-like FMN-dependent dehydrogenase